MWVSRLQLERKLTVEETRKRESKWVEGNLSPWAHLLTTLYFFLVLHSGFCTSDSSMKGLGMKEIALSRPWEKVKKSRELKPGSVGGAPLNKCSWEPVKWRDSRPPGSAFVINSKTSGCWSETWATKACVNNKMIKNTYNCQFPLYYYTY